MSLRKGKLVNIVTKVRQSGDGSEYWIVHLTDPDSGDALPQHLCFDKKIKDQPPNAVIEFDSVEKAGTWFFNFPGAYKGGAKRTSYGAGVKSDVQIRGSLLLQMHTMPMSYAKDIVVACINKAAEQGEVGVVEGGGYSPEKHIIEVYKLLRAEIMKDGVLLGVLGVGGSGEVKEPVKTAEGHALRKALDEETKAYIGGLSAMGYVLPEDALKVMLSRFSGSKDAGGKFRNGPQGVADMNDAQVKNAWDRFKLFSLQECEGDPNTCKYCKKGEDGETFCEWVLNCLYVKNANS